MRMYGSAVTGWYKRVLNALNVQVTTGVPYTQTSNPLCERHNRVVEQNLRILMKQERIKDWVRLVPWAVLTMNSQRSSSTGLQRGRRVGKIVDVSPIEVTGAHKPPHVV